MGEWVKMKAGGKVFLTERMIDGRAPERVQVGLLRNQKEAGMIRAQ